MSTRSRFTGFVAALSTSVLIAVACAPDGPQPLLTGPQFHEEDNIQGIEVCKFGPEGSTATFSITASGGVFVVGETFTLDALPANTCVDGINRKVVWITPSPVPDPLINYTVTVTETGASDGVSLLRIESFAGLEGPAAVFPPNNSVTVTVNNLEGGGAIYFYNEGEVTPPPGGEGCTPGYWKQSQHFDSWPAPYTPSTLFSSIFADAFPGKTLLQVLKLGGGGLNALGRHTVAALLNAGSADVDYDLAVAGVISAFNAAFASGDYEPTKNQFEGFNEQGCSLD